MAKKPWREIQFTDDAGRFTRQQIEDAMRKVMERREAKAQKPKTDRRAGLAPIPLSAVLLRYRWTGHPRTWEPAREGHRSSARDARDRLGWVPAAGCDPNRGALQHLRSKLADFCDELDVSPGELQFVEVRMAMEEWTALNPVGQ